MSGSSSAAAAQGGGGVAQGPDLELSRQSTSQELPASLLLLSGSRAVWTLMLRARASAGPPQRFLTGSAGFCHDEPTCTCWGHWMHWVAAPIVPMGNGLLVFHGGLARDGNRAFTAKPGDCWLATSFRLLIAICYEVLLGSSKAKARWVDFAAYPVAHLGMCIRMGTCISATEQKIDTHRSGIPSPSKGVPTGMGRQGWSG
ncbi:uncharacterized protein VDAG_08755 [Verticillium dahliae VdLs.17]|uniref:Uncharacterized protein n=1 Tax=Verticillium dahliae (strain VdLs.17 / ATCC MYA-4575 / FGSC 10137) TaxID=498257 RepID=G2XF23_VERDV|nr:uncharacterized protein VDAG_08755 [Verticillium dahliae VdLs.17]EGY18421.1 hypothetical protein VDAG_08755 [Verticillium dahliae VdLs.17]